ncbi:hypothetical protein ACJMK2_022459, partial [Sinanodonta woodiana]
MSRGQVLLLRLLCPVARYCSCDYYVPWPGTAPATIMSRGQVLLLRLVCPVARYCSCDYYVPWP